jgi:hypothetical protein
MPDLQLRHNTAQPRAFKFACISSANIVAESDEGNDNSLYNTTAAE